MVFAASWSAKSSLQWAICASSYLYCRALLPHNVGAGRQHSRLGNGTQEMSSRHDHVKMPVPVRVLLVNFTRMSLCSSKRSTIYGTEWPIMCWCAVKKLLTHSLTQALCNTTNKPISIIYHGNKLPMMQVVTTDGPLMLTTSGSCDTHADCQIKPASSEQSYMLFHLHSLLFAVVKRRISLFFRILCQAWKL